MAKETAEQKLLKLIETADAKDGGAGQAAAAAPVAPEAQAVLQSVSGVGVAPLNLNLPPFLNQLLGSLRLILPMGKSSGGFGLKEVNKILVLIIAIVGLMLAFDFMRGMKKFHAGVELDGEEQAARSSETFSPLFKDLTEYIAAVSKRNIFQPYERKVEQAVDSTLPATQLIAEQAKDLKLVGISWLDTPESATAMIEDVKTSTTYFLKKGEEFKGLKISTIYADRVILDYQGETMAMNL